MEGDNNLDDSELEFECRFDKSQYKLEETENEFVLKGHAHITFKEIGEKVERVLLSPRYIMTSGEYK